MHERSPCPPLVSPSPQPARHWLPRPIKKRASGEKCRCARPLPPHAQGTAARAPIERATRMALRARSAKQRVRLAPNAAPGCRAHQRHNIPTKAQSAAVCKHGRERPTGPPDRNDTEDRSGEGVPRKKGCDRHANHGSRWCRPRRSGLGRRPPLEGARRREKPASASASGRSPRIAVPRGTNHQKDIWRQPRASPAQRPSSTNHASLCRHRPSSRTCPPVSGSRMPRHAGKDRSRRFAQREAARPCARGRRRAKLARPSASGEIHEAQKPAARLDGVVVPQQKRRWRPPPRPRALLPAVMSALATSRPRARFVSAAPPPPAPIHRAPPARTLPSAQHATSRTRPRRARRRKARIHRRPRR